MINGTELATPEYSKNYDRLMTYGYAGQGWKSGSYYTNYISNNQKFYKIDSFYGKKIYTPFWNIIKETY